ncbi:MAG: macro domain-containing protein [Bdellovibrionaceae bacterium]|nr:macro domain-containing protein [Bdellovibrionales bacterium]MCB9084574.1 macro domain-containing protein [Pseudobdellovibrionaceae bacterium]
MVTYVKGDIFKSPAQVLTNPVNCVGVMGKGLAFAFKNQFPGLFKDYKTRCDNNQVLPGQPYLWESETHQILNFPTKRHWRDKSVLQDIDEGLKFLAENYEQMGIQSLALPALGCGLGGLQWSEVQPLVEQYLGSIPDLDVYVYAPEKSLPEDKGSRSDKDNSAGAEDTFAAHP